jgi:hypothetical protein
MSVPMNRRKRSSRPGRTSSLQGQYRRSHSRSDLRCDARSRAALSRPISADPRYGDRGDVGCEPDLPDVDRRYVRVVLEVRLSVSRLTSISSAVSTAYMLPSFVGASTPGLLCGGECIESASVATPTSSTAHPDAGASHGGSKAVQARRARPLVKLAYSAQTVPHGYRLLRIFATSKDPAVAALMSGPRSLRSHSPHQGQGASCVAGEVTSRSICSTSRAGTSGRSGAVPVGSTSYRAPARPSGLTAAELLLDDRSAQSRHAVVRMRQPFPCMSGLINFNAPTQIIPSLPVARLHVQA